MQPGLQRFVVLAILFAMPGCGVPPPFVPTSYGLGGSGGVDAAVVPLVSVLQVGQSLDYEFRVYDRIQGEYVSRFGDVTWVNENPSIVRLESPLGACGTRCARVTAVAPGYAQLRPHAVYEGVAVWGAWGIRVVE